MPDLRLIRDKYTAKTEPVIDAAGKVWNQTDVTVLKDGDPVFEYRRSYVMLHTFEPFRQLQDDVWHDYALVSPSYTSFSVLDLEAGKIVAELPRPSHPLTQEHIDRQEKAFPGSFENPNAWCFEMILGDPVYEEGFCPVDFYVPDIVEELGLRDEPDPADAWGYWTGRDDKDDVNQIPAYSGQFGFYCGCVWGDDSSDKLRYIDLSQIKDGIVSDEERFGYWELPKGRLKDNIDVEFLGDTGSMHVNLRMNVNLKTGKASEYSTKHIHVAKDMWDFAGVAKPDSAV